MSLAGSLDDQDADAAVLLGPLPSSRDETGLGLLEHREDRLGMIALPAAETAFEHEGIFTVDRNDHRSGLPVIVVNRSVSRPEHLSGRPAAPHEAAQHREGEPPRHGQRDHETTSLLGGTGETRLPGASERTRRSSRA